MTRGYKTILTIRPTSIDTDDAVQEIDASLKTVLVFSELGKWDFVVSLQIWFESRNSFQKFCSGSIISEYLVLTAAHCLALPLEGFHQS